MALQGSAMASFLPRGCPAPAASGPVELLWALLCLVLEEVPPGLRASSRVRPWGVGVLSLLSRREPRPQPLRPRCRVPGAAAQAGTGLLGAWPSPGLWRTAASEVSATAGTSTAPLSDGFPLLDCRRIAQNLLRACCTTDPFSDI